MLKGWTKREKTLSLGFGLKKTKESLRLGSLKVLKKAATFVWPKLFGSGKRQPEKPMTTDKEDMVNHPPHYKKGDMEAIKVIEAGIGDQGFVGYLLGNIMKYLLRFPHKGKPVEDLKKARWYLDRLILVVSKDKINN